VTDDIVTRLRESDGQGCTCGAYSYYECGCSEAVWAEMFIEEAADEIERLRELSFKDIYFGQLKIDEVEYLQEENERLRNALGKIEQAIVDEGKMPSYHRAVMKRHRQEWGTLHNAIDAALKVLHE